MLKLISALFLMICTTFYAQSTQSFSYRNTQFSVGAQFGLYNGIGGHINIKTTNFADDFPFSARLALGITYLDAGDPLAARKIFINNNTNGIPEQSGRTLNFGLDFLYRYSILNLKRNYFYLGPRYTMFTGNFNFIGGNEDFDVTSNLWGIGAGFENYFKIIPSIDLVINIEYDYYLSDTLYGHDTSYNPDGLDVNPREEFSFEDADKAINQPKHQAKVLLGFNYNF